MFDYKCACGWVDEKFVHRASDPVSCPQCGGATERFISHVNIVPDSVPGGFTIENISATPMTFYSKSEYRDALRAHGLVNTVRHVGVQGSDKSPHTTRWY